MAEQSLRDHLSRLEKAGRLFHVKAEVDKDWEIACVTRQTAGLPPQERYAIQFDRIRGHQTPVVVGAIGASRDIYALALGIQAGEIHERWLHALRHPVEPRMTTTAPCQEHVERDGQVDLQKFPVPIWTPTKDGGPYFSAGCVVMKDPETGIQNVGIYRLMVHSSNLLGVLIVPAKHSGIIYSKYEAMNRPMEVAVVIGPPPSVVMTGAGRVPYGVDELAVAGGLLGSPLDLVKCQTVDLQVPAQSEMVIEGVIPPHERRHEGPFGEFFGYMGEDGDAPVVKVQALCYRSNPIHQGIMEQKPPSEGSYIKDIAMESILLGALRGVGVPGVLDVHVGEMSAQSHVVVAIQKLFPGHAKAVMHGCWASYPNRCKQVTVVEGDCDIYDSADVEWHIASRVQPDRDIEVISEATGHTLDPSMPEGRKTYGAKMGVDATRKHLYPEVSLPPEEILNRARKDWKRYGLPAL